MFDRHDKVISLMKELSASFIRNEANPNPLITVTNVTISPDYKKTTIFITTIPDGGEDDALIFLKRKGRELRSYMKKHTNLRVIPHIEFEIDRGERHRQNIDKIARNIEEETNNHFEVRKK